ncbi:Cytochrome P450 71D11 (Fragment) [Linum grandiflorum]
MREDEVAPELAPNFPLTIVVLLLTILISIGLIFLQTVSQKIKRIPPGPWKLPIIGNLHQMVSGNLYQMVSGNLLPHRRLTELATKYGPLMHLQLGEVSTVIVSSAELAKEFLQTNDINFATRPYLPSAYTIFYQGRDIVFGNGDYWKQMRKICVQELLAPNRVKSLVPIIEEEVNELVRSIQPRAISNTGGMLVSLGYSLMSRIIFGKHFDSFFPVGREIIRATGGSNLSDLFPSSYLVRLLTSSESKLKKLHNKADVVLQTIIDDHITRRSSNLVNEADEDIVDVLLNHSLHQDLQIPITHNDIKAVLLDIFIAGSDTSSSTIEWTLAELTKNSQIMKKAQKEVRNQFNAKGRIDYKDIDQLHYLKLVIKETLRLHPPAPLLGPREAREAAMIHGYHIPGKTKIIINAWAIAHDHHNWHEPERFCPERFLNDLSSNNDYSKGLDFSSIPFGSGRRICPGVQLGMAILTLSLANLLYHFNWEFPSGINSQNLDMSEEFGIAVKKKKELLLVPIPYHAKVL